MISLLTPRSQPHSDGDPLAYYDDGTHTLRLLGRVLPAPPADPVVGAFLGEGEA
jgi:hypothetical protein